jgi:small subunit ribosomal protein S19
MARSVWKGPFVEESLMKKVDKYREDPKKIPIKTWSRKSTILPDFVGVSFQIYNGKKIYTNNYIRRIWLVMKLGEFHQTIELFMDIPPAD